jgi:senataxin
VVCAPSNAASDELMGRFIPYLSKAPGLGKVLRVGRNTRPELKAYSLDSIVMESQSKEESFRQNAYREKKGKFFDQIREINDQLGAVGATMEGNEPRRGDLIRQKERLKEALDNLKSRETESVKCERDSVCRKLLSSAQFIFGTLSSFGSDSVWNNMPSVDYCVIDEAAQSIEVSSLIPLKFTPKRIVLVGDPQQLPAVVKSAAAKRLRFDMSLIERLQLLGNRTYMLREQYRMHPSIAEISSEFFYEGKLITPNSVVARYNGSLRSLPSALDTPIVFINVESSCEMKSGNSIINPREGRITGDCAKFLAANRVGSVGVIAPYKQQVGLIRKLLGNDIEVDSVDAFQGREKEFIVFNCVRSGGDTVGFLADYRRLNVAITRARRGLWIVGNADFVANRGGPVWASLVEHCRSNGYIVDCRKFEDVMGIS